MPVNLRQVRDFGETFSATSRFMRQNGKPIYRALGLICLPPLLLVSFLMGERANSFVGSMLTMGNDPSQMVGSIASFYGIIFLCGLLGWAITVLAIALVHEYIRAYHLGMHHGITTKQLWDSARQQYWHYFGASFLSGLLVTVGFMLCLLPGLFPITVLSLVLISHAIERTGAGESLGRSYKLVITDFWPVLGLILMMGLVLLVVYFIVVAIFQLISMVWVFSGIEDMAGTNDPSSMLSGVTILMMVQMVVQQIVQLLIYPYIWTALSLRYFSLVEQKEGAGLRERIQGFDQA